VLQSGWFDFFAPSGCFFKKRVVLLHSLLKKSKKKMLFQSVFTGIYREKNQLKKL